MGEKRTIVALAFGNPLLEDDRLAIDVVRLLRKRPAFKNVEFYECNRPEQLFGHITRPNVVIVILDATKGINHPAFIDLESIAPSSRPSSHDFGPGEFMALARESGLIQGDVKILGLPYGARDVGKIALDAGRLLNSLLP